MWRREPADATEAGQDRHFSGTLFGVKGNDPSLSRCGSEVLTVAPPATIGATGTVDTRRTTVTSRPGSSSPRRLGDTSRR